MNAPDLPLNTPGAQPPAGGAGVGADGADSTGETPFVRPTVIQLSIKEKGALYAAYIPMFTEGGIFVPSSKSYRLGQDVYVLLTLPEDAHRYPIAGKVAWITPPHATGARTQGIGIRFPNDEKSAQLKKRIEEILGAHLGSDRPTQTV
ncbi:MAG: PilZ domain-containing protein [Hydrogenophaga sp.]|nr:PilZ domain-containing protein [Hydrogenophaga sp.]